MERIPEPIGGYGKDAWFSIHYSSQTTQEELSAAEDAVAALPALIDRALALFAAELADGSSTTATFRDFHVSELDAAMVCELFDVADPQEVTDEILLDHLVLQGIAICPGRAERALSLDFGVGEDLPTDQLLVAQWDADQAMSVTWES